MLQNSQEPYYSKYVLVKIKPSGSEEQITSIEDPRSIEFTFRRKIDIDYREFEKVGLTRPIIGRREDQRNFRYVLRGVNPYGQMEDIIAKSIPLYFRNENDLPSAISS